MTGPVVFLFPGQGSQVVGMGQDLYHEYDFVREIFDMTDDLCRAHISRLCFNGPMEDLTRTKNLQPAVTAVNLACLEAVRRMGGPAASMAAGHSLGEFSALAASGAVTFEEAMRLVFRRGELMEQAAAQNPGAMSAVVGLTPQDVDLLVKEAAQAGEVSVANYNTADQTVVTGSPEAVAAVSALAKKRGGRAVPLKVSGAWHSRLMEGAAKGFAEFLTAFPFAAPAIPVVPNVTAEPCQDAAELHAVMGRQLTSPVRWHESVRTMHEAGAKVFVELGPKKVLANMVKKILPEESEARVRNVGGMKELEEFLKKEA